MVKSAFSVALRVAEFRFQGSRANTTHQTRRRDPDSARRRNAAKRSPDPKTSRAARAAASLSFDRMGGPLLQVNCPFAQKCPHDVVGSTLPRPTSVRGLARPEVIIAARRAKADRTSRGIPEEANRLRRAEPAAGVPSVADGLPLREARHHEDKVLGARH